MTLPRQGLPESLLKRIERWLREVGHGKIVLNADAHAVKSFEITEFGKVTELDDFQKVVDEGKQPS